MGDTRKKAAGQEKNKHIMKKQNLNENQRGLKLKLSGRSTSATPTARKRDTAIPQRASKIATAGYI